MAITAAQVKQLRERTGAGMMECKKALVETNGDLEAAVEHMRKTGLAKADKKAGRTAAEGVVAVAQEGGRAALVEVNSETDFVAKGDEFQAFANAVARRVLTDAPADVDALLALPLEDGGADINTVRQELVARLGENMAVRRFVRFEAANGAIGSYLHGTRIGVLVVTEGGDESLARDIAMHVAASQPVAVDSDGVPADLLAKEEAIYKAQAAESGKPADIVEKMVQGRMRKFLGEVTLVGQPFVKDPDQTVGQLLESANAKVVEFARLEVGEGIEKEEADFAKEVMEQAQGR